MALLFTLVACTSSTTEPTDVGPGATGDTAQPTAPTGTTGLPSTTPTGDTGPEPWVELTAPARWGLPDWSRPQHHAQVAWSADGRKVHLAFSEGEYLPDPTVRLGAVDPATSAPVGDVVQLGGPSGILGIKPAIDLDAAGNVVVGYQGAGGGVYTERVTGGVAGEFLEVQAPNALEGAGNHSVDLVVRPDGNAVVAWYAQSAVSEDAAFYTAIVAPGGTRAPGGGQVARFPDLGVATPELALLGDGTPLLAWSDLGSSPPALKLSWLGADALPTSTVTIYDDGGQMLRPQLAVGADGRIAVTFPIFTAPEDSTVAVMVVDAAGVPLYAPVAPFTVPAEPDLSTIAWVGADTLLVAWSSHDLVEDDSIWIALLSASDGAVLEGPTRVSDEVTNNAHRPTLAVLEEPGEPARFALAWEQANSVYERELLGVFGTLRD